jgi:hypothetical protein
VKQNNDGGKDQAKAVEVVLAEGRAAFHSAVSRPLQRNALKRSFQTNARLSRENSLRYRFGRFE